MKRYVIQTNDKTTANGTVQARSTTFGLDDQQVANEGDGVSCPACQPTSKISVAAHAHR